MATITYDETPYTAQARTTDGTATAVVFSGIFTVADKSSDEFYVEAIAVREATANPLVSAIGRVFTWGLVAAVPAQATGSPTLVYRHGDASLDVTMALTGGANPVVIKVTGVAATTYNWVVTVRRRVLTSV